MVSWSDTQITATVAANARSGKAQVQQRGTWSNSTAFTVNTANILSVSPNSGVVQTIVTVTGSGFGASQGTGQLWLGTANAVIMTWSDTQIVAQVAAGSASGGVQVLQGGVLSNSVPFTVNSLAITSVTPVSAQAGASVTISGIGFGTSQGLSSVTIGSSAAGQILSWSNTQIVATVATGSVSGVVRVSVGGALSNPIGFIVLKPGGGGGGGGTGTVSILAPTVSSMVVGDSRSLQALNSTGGTVTGLAWSSSDPSIVSLSTDDPPVLTALAAGNVTITAGGGTGATATVTVYPVGGMPTGTTLWSNPGDGSGVNAILPAVPSSTGVADVFACQASGNIQAR